MQTSDIRVDLVVPIKGLAGGKSRLRDELDPATHIELTMAIALDTVTAAAASRCVRRLLVVTSDAVVADAIRKLDVEVLAEPRPQGLNPALRHGVQALRTQRPHGVVGALQSDLPALRPVDLSVAVTEAGGRRSFCADRQGTGTTLLLSTAGGQLRPAFGPGSASAHARTGATVITAPVPGLRCDVDTKADLDAAAALGLGPRTAAVLDRGRAGGSR